MTGTNIQISVPKTDPYFEKGKEFDDFFIKTFYENKWGLNENVPESFIRGYDERGDNGLWKRMLKMPYKKLIVRDNILIIQQN